MSRLLHDSSEPTGYDEQALALVHEGWNHLQLQRPFAAWSAWQRALRIAPGFSAATEALETLGHAAELPATARTFPRFRAPRDPERRASWDRRFQQMEIEHLPDAADAFAALVGEDRTDAAAWFNRALCLAWNGRNVEAISCLDRVVELDAPTHFDDAVGAWSVAEILRQGGGAEALADDLRYSWVLDWDERDTARLRDGAILQRVALPPDKAAGTAPIPSATLYEWLDRRVPDASVVLTADELPRMLSTVVITPGSLRLSSPDPETLEEVGERIVRVLGEAPTLQRREASPLTLPLLDAAVWMFRRPAGLDLEVESQLAREAVEQFYERLWIHRPRQGLGNRSPLEAGRLAAAGDRVISARLTAVVRVREELGRRPRTAKLYQGYPFDRLRRRLGLDLDDPAAVDLSDASCMSEAELDRLDIKALAAHALVDAFRSAAALRNDERSARFAAEVVRRNAPEIAEAMTPALFAVLVREAMRRGRPEEALAWLEIARSSPNGRDRQTYDIWSAEIHARAGDPDAALAVYQSLFRDADAGLSPILDAAEELIMGGYHEHAAPLLDLGLARARERGDGAALARALAIAGEDRDVTASRL